MRIKHMNITHTHTLPFIVKCILLKIHREEGGGGCGSVKGNFNVIIIEKFLCIREMRLAIEMSGK